MKRKGELRLHSSKRKRAPGEASVFDGIDRTTIGVDYSRKKGKTTVLTGGKAVMTFKTTPLSLETLEKAI